MSKWKIIQIGVGGTGAHAAKALAHGIINMDATHRIEIDWVMVDPDTIELKNQLRQPFYGVGAVGSFKADYVNTAVSNIVTAGEEYSNTRLNINVSSRVELISDPEKFLNSISAEYITDPETNVVIMLAVDNTFTRNKFETFFASRRDTFTSTPLTDSSRIPKRLHYVDMGNTDKSWILVSLPFSAVPVSDYGDTLSLPDPMLSCAERAETTSIPQTTFMNEVCGCYAAKSVLKLIADHERLEIPMGYIPYYGEVTYSKNDQVTRHDRLREISSAIKDLSAVEIPDRMIKSQKEPTTNL